MQKFDYKVKDQEGQTRKGVVEARSDQQAVRVLRERGFWIISIRPKRESLTTEVKKGFFSRIKETDKVNFTRQLSTMVTAGLPITDALSLLESQAGPAMAKVVGEILREVESGSSLTIALEKHPEAFDRIYISLIRAGEAAGVLDKVLSRLADNLEKQREFRSKVKGAMVYPAIVVTGMVVVAVIMMVFVIPKMTSIYEEFQADLPALTKVFLKISTFVSHFWWLGLFGLAGLFLAYRFLSKKPTFRDYWDRFLFRVPIIGKLRRQIILTEFTRTLGMLLGAGILIVEAINIVCFALGSSMYARAVKKAGEEVERGLSLAAALARTQVFPALLPQMIAVGEETGKIDEVLAKIAAYFEQEADNAVKGLTTALEPLIMIVLGVGVGFLIVAIIMPIYNLAGQF